MKVKCALHTFALAACLSGTPVLAGVHRGVDVRALASHTAAVIDGEVVDVEFTHSASEGPWTLVRLAGVRTLIGARQPAKVTLRIEGGFLPSGDLVIADDQPVFAKGKRYVLFLRNDEWMDWPVISSLVLRVDRIAGREVLVNQQELPVVGFSAAGLEFDKQPLFDDERDLLFHVRDSRPPAPRAKVEAAAVARCLSLATLRAALLRELGTHRLTLHGQAQYERPLASAALTKTNDSRQRPAGHLDRP
jgi:hypothetical protein